MISTSSESDACLCVCMLRLAKAKTLLIFSSMHVEAMEELSSDRAVEAAHGAAVAQGLRKEVVTDFRRKGVVGLGSSMVAQCLNNRASKERFARSWFSCVKRKSAEGLFKAPHQVERDLPLTHRRATGYCSAMCSALCVIG